MSEDKRDIILITIMVILSILFALSSLHAQVMPFGFVKATTPAGPTYEAQSDSLFARMTSAGSTPSDNRKTLINNVIKMLKDSLSITSLYNAFDLFYVMAARDTIQAKLNWVNSSYTLQGVFPSYSSNVFVADSGFRGFVNYEWKLKTGYIPNTNKVTFLYNNSSIGGWCTQSYDVATYSMWGVFSDSWTYGEQFVPGSSMKVRSHTYTEYSISGGSSPYTGLYHVLTPDADSVVVYKNGARIGGTKRGSSAGATLTSKDIWLLARNNESTGDNFTYTRMSFFYVGKKFTPLEIRKIYNVLKYYLDNCSSNT